jgi:hypothetical protein
MKVSFWKILVAGILFAIIGYVIHSLGAFFMWINYRDFTYYEVWCKLTMPAERPIPPSFIKSSFIFSLIVGILIALVYAWIMEGLKGKSGVSKGLFYGFMLFLVAGLPSFLSLYILMDISDMFNITWMVEGLILYLIGGLIIGALVKQ